MTNLLKQPKLPLAVKLVLGLLILVGIASVMGVVLTEEAPSTLMYNVLYVGTFCGVVAALTWIALAKQDKKPAESEA